MIENIQDKTKRKFYVVILHTSRKDLRVGRHATLTFYHSADFSFASSGRFFSIAGIFNMAVD